MQLICVRSRARRFCFAALVGPLLLLTGSLKPVAADDFEWQYGPGTENDWNVAFGWLDATTSTYSSPGISDIARNLSGGKIDYTAADGSSTIDTFISSDTNPNDGALYVKGGSLTVEHTFFSIGDVQVQGGTLYAGFLGTGDFNSGKLEVTGGTLSGGGAPNTSLLTDYVLLDGGTISNITIDYSTTLRITGNSGNMLHGVVLDSGLNLGTSLSQNAFVAVSGGLVSQSGGVNVDYGSLLQLNGDQHIAAIVTLGNAAAGRTGYITGYAPGETYTLDASTGEITGDGTVTINGDTFNNNSFIVANDPNGSLTLNNEGYGTGKLNNAGTLQADGGTLGWNGDSMDNTGRVEAINGGNVNIGFTGALVNHNYMQANGANSLLVLSAGGPGITNDGTIAAGKGGEVGVIASSFFNSGTIQIDAASKMIVQNDITQMDGLTKVMGTLDMTGHTFFLAGGILNGTGTFMGSIDQTAGTSNLGSDPQEFHIIGDYSISGGVYQVDIASGSQFDVLNATGDVKLNGGTLDLNFLNGFQPTTGEAFDIIVAGGITGHFGSIESNLKGFDFSYHNGVITAAPVPEAGTLVTFGATLALGGLGLRRRRC